MGLTASCFNSSETTQSNELEIFEELSKSILEDRKSSIWSIQVQDEKYIPILNEKFKILGVQLFSLRYNVRIDRVVSSFRSINHLVLSDSTTSINLTYYFSISNKYIIPYLDEKNLEPVFYKGIPYCLDLCVVCDDLTTSQVILPCGHLCLCKNCCEKYYQKTVNYPKNCPMCSNKILKIESYLSVGFERKV